MTFREYFFLFVAIFGWICGFVAINESEKTKEENNRLRNCLLAEQQKAIAWQKAAGVVDGRHREFFDFEKVNSKEEK